MEKISKTNIVIKVGHGLGKSYCNAQTALPIGLKQLLIIEGITRAGSDSTPKPGAKYIEETKIYR